MLTMISEAANEVSWREKKEKGEKKCTEDTKLGEWVHESEIRGLD